MSHSKDINEKMVELKPSKSILKQTWKPDGMIHKAIKKSLPFLESLGGFYAHRVKHVTMQTFDGKSHFIVKVWCGASFCTGGSGRGQTVFLQEPTANKPICATCEGRYIGAGMIDDQMINGRKVMYRTGGFNG